MAPVRGSHVGDKRYHVVSGIDVFILKISPVSLLIASVLNPKRRCVMSSQILTRIQQTKHFG